MIGETRELRAPIRRHGGESNELAGTGLRRRKQAVDLARGSFHDAVGHGCRRVEVAARCDERAESEPVRPGEARGEERSRTCRARCSGASLLGRRSCRSRPCTGARGDDAGVALRDVGHRLDAFQNTAGAWAEELQLLAGESARGLEQGLLTLLDHLRERGIGGRGRLGGGRRARRRARGRGAGRARRRRRESRLAAAGVDRRRAVAVAVAQVGLERRRRGRTGTSRRDRRRARRRPQCAGRARRRRRGRTGTTRRDRRRARRRRSAGRARRRRRGRTGTSRRDRRRAVVARRVRSGDCHGQGSASTSGSEWHQPA